MPAAVVIVPSGATRRIRWFSRSAMRTLASGALATPFGVFSAAAVPGPPSPWKPANPSPARVVMVPSGATRRTRWLFVSTITKPPSLATARPIGSFSCAEVAGPPSPLKPAEPIPATVVMTPFGATLRIRLLSLSAIRYPPSACSARSAGKLSCASVAWPPSPPNVAAPVPATVLMVPSSAIRRTRLLFASAISTLPSPAITAAVGALICAAVAGPPSPLKPCVVPAMVMIVPSGRTRRMRLLPWSTIR
ncbi:MAG: hypothetical protein QOJ12_176 [Thermoleophilales bacterium]|nr:hypothetical protein [Thermoleophilales bacterium]